MTETLLPPLNLRPDVNEHNCFGCGKLNIHGLHLELLPDPDSDGVVTYFVPPAHTEGYSGMVHGGIISTVLDEVMAWSLYRHGIWAVTGELTIRYRRPVEVGKPVVARGHVVSDRGRVIDVHGEIRDEQDNLLLAQGTAKFVRVPHSQVAAWDARYGGVAQKG
jgi:uncharacterized protein (TIGR00369 family)